MIDAFTVDDDLTVSEDSLRTAAPLLEAATARLPNNVGGWKRDGMKAIFGEESEIRRALLGRKLAGPNVKLAVLSAPSNSDAAYPGKRLFDLTLAIGVLPIALPILVLSAGWIFFISPGSPLYRQTRLGYGGRKFTLYKLRTMISDSEACGGTAWMPKNDARVIPGGGFLRRWHIDELPQLWNVLCGDMSLVGPRPVRPDIIDRLDAKLSDLSRRLTMKPGITGLAQVTLPSDSDVLGFQRKTLLDFEYIGTVKFRLDVKILVWTALKMLGFRECWIYPKAIEASGERKLPGF